MGQKFLNQLDHDDNFIRRAAVKALDRLTNEVHIRQALLARLEDEDDEYVRRTIVEMLLKYKHGGITILGANLPKLLYAALLSLSFEKHFSLQVQNGICHLLTTWDMNKTSIRNEKGFMSRIKHSRIAGYPQDSKKEVRRLRDVIPLIKSQRHLSH
ncbi:hypothetical protein BX600DRAFT_440862 [Xylariales sp. PMI_506]|nr:hypothetical protein BX600DRAFT_440862 [Xylariales sp. PMI_506]